MFDKRNLKSDFSNFFIENVDFRSKKVSFIKKSISFIRNGYALEKLNRILEQENPDIAHLHNIYHQITPSIIPLLKKNGVKVVLTMHDYKLSCPCYTHLSGNDVCNKCSTGNFYHATKERCESGSLVKSLLLSLEAYYHKILDSYSGVDKFVAPSEFLKEQVSERVPPEKTSVVPNGVNESLLSEYVTDGGYILYFGRLSAEKGVSTLIQAYNLSDQKVPLIIAGTGPLLEQLKAQESKAEFLGYLSGKPLHKMIKNCSFVVVPSEWYENCSMAVIEAMAYGKPVVASNIGGLPEQVKDSLNGYLFEPGNAQQLSDAMTKLMNNPCLRAEMGKESRRIVSEKYTLAIHNNHILSIYNELLGEANG